MRLITFIRFAPAILCQWVYAAPIQFAVLGDAQPTISRGNSDTFTEVPSSTLKLSPGQITSVSGSSDVLTEVPSSTLSGSPSTDTNANPEEIPEPGPEHIQDSCIIS
ncbi:hypothetical protein FB451DRAFT_1278119 [Mycena latifolia]|nr:hypothetical protein FB451DRAFT_1278119 [Mycena latifolia]